ncbi:MAG: sensor histidine kinase [Firmicutes bacterium HGW-Firmicutes-14]|nr:MAG: sensor histidine kinase [Firmicutes bacterium HGW-Firmicutes-14]
MQLSKPLWEGKLFLVILTCIVLAGFVPAVLFTVVIGSRILRKMLKPIDNMIGTAKAISAADLNTRLSVVDSHDELKDLAETFNDMLDRIQASYEQQDRFVSDASHELRTPIAVIQGYANLLQRWGKEDKAVLDESVSAIKNEAENMKDLVERLLFLARADKNTQKIEKTLFSLSELVNELMKETKLIDTEHTVKGEVTGIVSINGDRKLIKQALRVFLDNSIRYTPAGGTIKIEGRVKGNTGVVEIEDNGIGISSEDLPHIFDRFYKCDKSRTREGGSTGLGLSIAKWIIERHGGSIAVESALNKGTKVIITLPV